MKEPLPSLLGSTPAIIGRTLSDSEAELIQKYLEILTEWNQCHRIVGSADTRWLVENVVLDSLLFVKAIPPTPKRVLDVGSGAGVPGIPIKIIMPEIDLVMVESRRKRASFLSTATRMLKLQGARVVHARIEHVGAAEIGRFDTIVARCTASPERLFDSVRPFLTEDGTVIVSGPPGVVGDRPKGIWVSVDNPITGGKRNFAVMRSTWNRKGV